MSMLRRKFLSTSVLSAAFAAALGPRAQAALLRQEPGPARKLERAIHKGRLKQSVSRWCYGGFSLEELCGSAAALGYASVELLDEPEWSVPAQFGLVCALGNGPGPIHKGWNRLEHHEQLVAQSERLIPLAAAAKVPTLIVFSGNRAGQADEEGVRNCVTGLKRIVPLAEKHGVDLVIEYLNSKVDHTDYQFDHMAWGVAVVKGVGSPRLKILYDIYHAQIMEGDVIRTIRDNFELIGHYHTGGVPGRGEIDATQELNYSAVCRAIADLGFKGFVAQEFVPQRDPLTSLAEAGSICDQ